MSKLLSRFLYGRFQFSLTVLLLYRLEKITRLRRWNSYIRTIDSYYFTYSISMSLHRITTFYNDYLKLNIYRHGLNRVHSPLLTTSRLILVFNANKMIQFTLFCRLYKSKVFFNDLWGNSRITGKCLHVTFRRATSFSFLPYYLLDTLFKGYNINSTKINL